MGVGIGIGAKVGLLGKGAAGPVFLHVGTTFVEPTVVGYEPTEGGTTDPYPSVPFCASAAVLERAKATANATVLSFMRCFSRCFRRDNRTVFLPFPKFFFKRDRSHKPFTSRRASMLQQSSSIAYHSTLTLLDFIRSHELSDSSEGQNL